MLPSHIQQKNLKMSLKTVISLLNPDRKAH